MTEMSICQRRVSQGGTGCWIILQIVAYFRTGESYHRWLEFCHQDYGKQHRSLILRVRPMLAGHKKNRDKNDLPRNLQ